MVFWGIWVVGLAAVMGLALELVPGGGVGLAAVVLGLSISIAVGVMSQRCGFFASPLTRVRTARGRLSLTFDDGPDPKFTPMILDLLAEAGHRATFFVVGERLARHPELGRRIVEQGHELGNHSMGHRWHMAFWPPERIARDLERASELIKEHTGTAAALFRPPVAVLSPRIAAGARQAGVTLVGYSVRSGDGSPMVPPAVVLARLRGGLEEGAILLLHDGRVSGRAPASIQVLPQLLEEMAAADLTSVPVSELARARKGL